MRVPSHAIAAIAFFCVAPLWVGATQAQTIHVSVEDIALRNGETIEFGDVYLIGTDCSSLLTREPQVEVLEGPPGVAVAIKRATIVPYERGCETSVLGGKMLITARDIVEYSYSRMILRIRYETPSGNVQRSQHINVTLFP